VPWNDVRRHKQGQNAGMEGRKTPHRQLYILDWQQRVRGKNLQLQTKEEQSTVRFIPEAEEVGKSKTIHKRYGLMQRETT
jgi:hypothetical protein